MEGVPLDAEMGVSEEPATKQPKFTLGSMYVLFYNFISA